MNAFIHAFLYACQHAWLETENAMVDKHIASLANRASIKGDVVSDCKG